MRKGFRTPSVSKSIKARTTGRVTRAVKSSVIPAYGKKGAGIINNPSKSFYNAVYNKTSIDTLKPLKQSSKSIEKDNQINSLIKSGNFDLEDYSSFYLRLKLFYKLQNTDKYHKEIISLNICSRGHTNPEYKLNKEQIREQGLDFKDIYKYLKTFSTDDITIDYVNDSLVVFVKGQPIGEIQKSRANKLYNLYSSSKIDDMNVFIYGGETKNLAYDETYNRGNFNGEQYLVELLVFPHETETQTKRRLEKFKKDQEVTPILNTETPNYEYKDENKIASDGDWALFWSILYLCLFAFCIYVFYCCIKSLF